MDYLISLLELFAYRIFMVFPFRRFGMVGLILDSTSDSWIKGQAGFCHRVCSFCHQALSCSVFMQGDLLGQGLMWATWEKAHCQSPGQSSISPPSTWSPSLPGSSSFPKSPSVLLRVLGPDKPSVAHMTLYALHTDRIFHLEVIMWQGTDSWLETLSGNQFLFALEEKIYLKDHLILTMAEYFISEFVTSACRDGWPHCFLHEQWVNTCLTIVYDPFCWISQTKRSPNHQTPLIPHRHQQKARKRLQVPPFWAPCFL